MKKISLQARSIIRRAIVSLLSSMGFITVHGQATGKVVGMDAGKDSFEEERIYPDSALVVLYGCPSADFRFRGNVTDKYGNPIKDVSVQVTHCQNGAFPPVMTDEDGKFVVEYMTAPWCDIRISATNDISSACDTIMEAEYKDEFVMPDSPSGDPFYRGVYDKEMTIVLGDEGETGQIIFGRPNTTGVNDEAAEKILLISNPVENYLWFNLTGEESANVAIYNLSGEQMLSASVPSGESLYVGNLKSGNYLLTVVSGDKKLAARFLKK